MIENYYKIITKIDLIIKSIYLVIPKEKKVIMGNYLNIRTGKLNANEENINGIYPFFTCSENESFINTFAFDTSAMLISGNGSNLGYINYYEGKFNAYQRTYVVDGHEYIYLFYSALQSEMRNIVEQSKGSAIPYLTLPMLSNFEIEISSNEIINKKYIDYISNLLKFKLSIKNYKRELENLKKQYLNKFFG